LPSTVLWAFHTIQPSSFILQTVFFYSTICLQCFAAVGWAAGRASGLKKLEWCGTGMVICLEWGANDLYLVQLMPLPPHHLLLQ